MQLSGGGGVWRKWQHQWRRNMAAAAAKYGESWRRIDGNGERKLSEAATSAMAKKAVAASVMAKTMANVSAASIAGENASGSVARRGESGVIMAVERHRRRRRNVGVAAGENKAISAAIMRWRGESSIANRRRRRESNQ